jgi:ATP-dependent Lhr-like helicase
MEARGEIRGGRFVAGFTGEQYALPEAVGRLRAVRRSAPDGALIALSAADPLNLLGLLTPGGRVPVHPENRLLYRDGVPVAIRVSGDIRVLTDTDGAGDWELRQALVRRNVSPQMRRVMRPA